MGDAAEAQVPTACRLDPYQARERVARWRGLTELARPKAYPVAPDAVQLQYPNSPDVIEELTILVAREAECCPFLVFTVEAAGADVVLVIRPAPGANLDVAASLTAFTSLATG